VPPKILGPDFNLRVVSPSVLCPQKLKEVWFIERRGFLQEVGLVDIEAKEFVYSVAT